MSEEMEQVRLHGRHIGTLLSLLTKILSSLLWCWLFLITLALVHPLCIVARHEEWSPLGGFFSKDVFVKDIHVPSENSVDSVSSLAVFTSPVFSTLFSNRWRFCKNGWVTEVALGTHNTISSRGLETFLDILLLENVSIRKNDCLLGQAVP
ncbi:hypothetical protein HG530_002968 [Fusarium avenaceum]|nr:hypothetical protein HG530_002968 [Fusarium avenaceum]